MTKAELRKQSLRARKALSEHQAEVYSKMLLEQFKRLNFEGVRAVHLFLPILEQREPDTFLFIEWLEREWPEVKVIVPRADFDTALMTHHVYRGREELVKNLYNILEPPAREWHTGDIDVVLVPLLAFDLRGYRVGYGKGFYDRFLGAMQTRKVGLSFFGPVELIDDVHQDDVRLDICITPERIYEFS
ncbi:5-formyltetrahydrofolate cyclo-ligase [Pedobacter sp. JY14-1]|uniref:5-formyltetrahydrofolate cyclo-ligase n=1 Tax=Pedobacter sp. JY14-1 TaxID=3034151 RepID=UPI0023E1693D|nr:5-formyltetrahydrofolate cyclo-ligase [Pedobacter sp. JY14-1]